MIEDRGKVLARWAECFQEIVSGDGCESKHEEDEFEEEEAKKLRNNRQCRRLDMSGKQLKNKNEMK